MQCFVLSTVMVVGGGDGGTLFFWIVRATNLCVCVLGQA